MKYPPIKTKFKRKTTSTKVLVKKTEILDFIAQYGRHPSIHSDNPLESKMGWNLKNYTNKLVLSYDPIFHAKVKQVPTRRDFDTINDHTTIIKFVRTHKRLPSWNSTGDEQVLYKMFYSRRQHKMRKRNVAFFKMLGKLLDKYNTKPDWF
ncbi:MAG TPA: hypothetical protein DDY18_04510 [Flavobacterium sp.]|jgi:hypothetical protein|nr:hypothetical protein [Flavobacterium sp.]